MPSLPRRARHGESLTLEEHLGELRTRILISLGAVGGAFVFTYVFRKTIIEWLKRPLPDDTVLLTLSPGEAFNTSLTVSLYAALTIAVPILIWQIWAFLAPALEETSQRVVVRLVGFATLLLVAGMAFGYWVVLPNGLDFLINYDDELYQTGQVRARDYFGFAAAVIAGLGILFELPIFLLGLVRLRVLSADQLRRNRLTGLGLCIIGVVLLPANDFVSMAIQALPVLVLFELSIWLAVFFERRWEGLGESSPEPLHGR